MTNPPKARRATIDYDCDEGQFVMRFYAASGRYIGRRSYEPVQWYSGGEPAIPEAAFAEARRRRIPLDIL